MRNLELWMGIQKIKMSEKQNKKIAVVRIRGGIGIKKIILDTLKMLRVYRQNYCVVIESSPSYMGMIRKSKDYITWGEIDDETYKLLVEGKGEEYKGRDTDKKGKIKYKKFIENDGKKIKPFFRLSPPRKGFERKGIKVPFSKGGALGYREGRINALIKRML